MLSHPLSSYCNGNSNRIRHPRSHQSISAICASEIRLTHSKLPGYSLPYNDWGTDSALTGIVICTVADLSGWDHALMTVREQCMLFFINSITDKPEWYKKVHDEDTIAEWEQEAKEMNWEEVHYYGDMSTKMLEYVSMLDEHHVMRLLILLSASTNSVQRLFFTRGLASCRF
jgi:hypothetical protein